MCVCVCVAMLPIESIYVVEFVVFFVCLRWPNL